ncbi:MAG TPA: hypothetical protein VMW50_10345 [Dehalococcoidia bacterium]|nr:hypothetical protein [Dehalococcoidia bacterium]
MRNRDKDGGIVRVYRDNQTGDAKDVTNTVSEKDILITWVNRVADGDYYTCPQVKTSSGDIIFFMSDGEIGLIKGENIKKTLDTE